MADYIRDIPNGQMMIRDTGGWVEFWFKTGSSTWNNEQTWGYQANGAYVQQDFRLAQGGNWQRFGSVWIESSQDVMFRIIGEGLGWPTTDFWASISRGRVPDPPGVPYLVDRNTDRIRAAFNYNYDGGRAIDAAELWYSFDGTPRYAVSGYDVWVTGLSPKTRYYFWGRTHNNLGWSGFSGRAELWTLGVPDAPQPVFFSDIETTSVRAMFNFTGYDGGTPIREWQIGYGLNPNTPEAFRATYNDFFRDLVPGRRYFFWGRGRNDIGWGPWSGRSEVLLTAGAWVKDNGEWERALPWVKVGGVWRIAKGNIPVNGVWKVPKS